MKSVHHLQLGLLLLSIFAVYGWLQFPILQRYSLQMVALTALIYYLFKWISKQPGQLAPKVMSMEIVPITFAVLLLVGSTGNLNSIFYPLLFVYLFFLVFVAPPINSIITTLTVMFFFYALSNGFDLEMVAHLVSPVIVLFAFLFARNQYQTALVQQNVMKRDENILMKEGQIVTDFLEHNLKSNISQLKTASPEQQQQLISSIEEEVQILEHKLAGYNQTIKS